jgi:xanthine dehydrogenase small subunit
MTAMVVHLDDHHNVLRARLAFGGVAPIPERALETELALAGRPWNHDTIREAQKVLTTEFQPITDFRATRTYRERVLVNLLEKFYLEHPSQEFEVAL